MLEALVEYEASDSSEHRKTNVDRNGSNNMSRARTNTVADDLHKHFGSAEGSPEPNSSGPANPHYAHRNRQCENIQTDRERDAYNFCCDGYRHLARTFGGASQHLSAVKISYFVVCAEADQIHYPIAGGFQFDHTSTVDDLPADLVRVVALKVSANQ